MKKEMKEDLKKLEKEKWVGAGADADLDKAIERCYRYMEDSLNWVVAEAIAKKQTSIIPMLERRLLQKLQSRPILEYF